MVYEHVLNGRQLRTGDIISTKDGGTSLFRLAFEFLGAIIPGKVDHTVMYIGPGGLCVEAVLPGVITINPGDRWDSGRMLRERFLGDSFAAASSVPFRELGISEKREQKIREQVREYVLGCVGKPYNFGIMDPETESRYYCSQLVYKAYKAAGIDLNTRKMPGIPEPLQKIVFPQEILDATRVIPKNT